MAEVDVLKSLKAEYQTATGKEWKPDAQPAKSAPSAGGDNVAKDALTAKINEQGNLVRSLKSSNAAKVIFIFLFKIV